LYYRGERKERYFMEDLKREKIYIDPETNKVSVCPGREDSYERLIESNIQFEKQGRPMEEVAIDSAMLEEALNTLPLEERKLIYELYYLDKTEREVGALLKLPQATLHKRKKKALDRLRKFLE